jgi:GDP-4-dehydro-6-deoxy-D-mannose reductase
MLEKGWKVCGTVYHTSRNVAKLLDKICLVEMDIEDASRLRTLVAETKPDVVFHLASQAYVEPSWLDPEGTLRTNILGTLYLLEAIRVSKIDPVVVVTGSSAEYGLYRQEEGPISEEQAFRPGSPYAVSKIGEDMLAYTYWRSYGLRVIRVRPFALIGPRKTQDAVSDFARGIVRIERGQAETLSVGNLEAIRDVVDVRDGVRAMALLAECGLYGEAYNICAGIGRTLREILNELIIVSNRPINVIVDPERMRRLDDSVLVGDSRKLQRLGWKPEIQLRQTLADILAFWRTASDSAEVEKVHC